MSDDLREREPDRVLGDHPPRAGIRSDDGATGGGVPDPKPNRSGSGADTGEGEPGEGASSDDPTEWLRSAPKADGEG
jgi:hypothetical protein